MEKKTLGSFIAALRKAKGLTQQELADKLYVSNKAVSKWECGETSPDISLLPIIAEVLEVSCDELLRGERILTEEKSEKTEKRAEKQLKYMVNKIIFKYKIASLISPVIMLISWISLYLTSYSPLFGVFLFLCGSTVAVITQIFTLRWLNNKITYTEIFDIKISDELLKLINDIKYKYSFRIFYLIFFNIFFLIPFFVGNPFLYVNLISFNELLALIPVYNLFAIMIAFVAKELYKKVFFKNVTLKVGLIVFDLVQIGIIMVPLAFFFVYHYATSYYPTFGDNLGLYYITILACCVTLAIAALIKKDKKTITSLAVITLRNIAYLIALMVFFSDSYMIEYSGDMPYILSNNFLISLTIIVLTSASYILLTKLLPTKNKNIYSAE